MAEVAGLVLGVVPLIITALQEWDTVTRPFSRYKHFRGLTKSFCLKLQSQDFIFRQECKILLGPLLVRSSIDPEMAEDMMKNSNHEVWKERIPEDVEAEYLGDSREHCRRAINSVVEVLKSIVQKCYEYGIIDKVHKTSDHSHTHYEQWILTKNKLKYSFLNTGLDSQLEELREQNDAFRAISSQIRELSKLGLQSSKSNLVGLLGPKISLPTAGRLIHRASTQLYEGLKRACQCRNKHSLHFRLEPEVNNAQVRFTLALQHKGTDCTGNQQSPFWITIDSIFKDGIRDDPTHSEPDLTLARHVPNIEPHQHGYSCQLLGGFLRHTHLSALEHQTVPHDSDKYPLPCTSPASADVDHIDIIDISFEKDLCNRLQRYSLQDEMPRREERCLGYLEVPDATGKSILYFEANQTASAPTDSLTLPEFMTAAVRSSISGRLMPYEKVRLARQLATAVLQFHSTPIMGLPFESNDVVFYCRNHDMETRRPSLTTPHLNVRMQAHETGSNVIGDDLEETALIRNPHLFGLGIVLLELAFQTPLSDLHSEYPAYQSLHSEGKVRDYVLADKISRDNVISRELGTRYKEIVRKCLACDFGHGEDLSDQVLQDAFYRDVIYELDKHEKYLAKIWGG